jgi:putative restriction endonuclease
MAVPEEFDRPIYKVLARNDTGAAPGHQGGFVLPKDLEQYLPLLKNRTSFAKPTVEHFITADLFDGQVYLETVETRYQYQTWGGERSPERRITGNISSLRNLADEDDILIIERGIQNEDHYRFTLVRAGTPRYSSLLTSFGGKRWGVLFPGEPPVLEVEIENAESEIIEAEDEKFSMFDADAGFSESRSRRISRSRAFQRRLHEVYQNRCAFCESGLLHPKGWSETDAAHIVPRSLKGADDTRNGILLCKAHHWAFDVGMIGISGQYKIIVPRTVAALPENASLSPLASKEICLPKAKKLLPSLQALEWHRKNLLLA